MIFLLLDILIYNLTDYNSYFFLLSLIAYKADDYMKMIFISLFLDFIVLSVPFINTIILSILFFVNKTFFKLKKKTLVNYLLMANFNFTAYNLILSILYSFDIRVFAISYIINIVFYLLSYNMLKKHIKLSR